MDISINLTLFIQIFHFIIAYYLITNLLLKPALSILEEDENEYLDLNQAIMEEKKIFDIKNQEKIKAWRECQNYFKANRPEVLLKIGVFEGDNSSIESERPLKQTEKQKLVDDIVKTIKSKLVYD